MGKGNRVDANVWLLLSSMYYIFENSIRVLMDRALAGGRKKDTS